MFGLFKKKNQSPTLTHYVYLNQISKYRMMMEEVNQAITAGYHVMLIYHFDETGIMLQKLTASTNLNGEKLDIRKSDQVELALRDKRFTNLQVMVAEVYPMAGKDHILESIIHQNYPGTKVIFYTSTDGPLMRAFGGEKIQNMMITLGLSENEKIEHSMVSKSIANAQEKIKNKVQFEKPATSKQEWMNINLPPNQ